MDRRHLARTAVGLALTVTFALGPATPAGAVRFGSESRPLMSDNVTPLLTIPAGKPIGARFRDQYMYITGTEGLTIYDVSDPALPKPMGALPLPHFENEDVDLGGNILLISNDPSESIGVLYVIDISNPNAPIVKGAMLNGLGDGQGTDAAAEITGAINDLVAIFGLPVPAIAPPAADESTYGIGHTASCVKADCSWAYLAGTNRGIEIVDLRDPSSPKIAGRFVPEITGKDSPSVVDTTHDVQVDAEGIAWIVGADGTAGYDVTDPLHPKLLARTDESIVNSGQGGLPSIDAPSDPVFNFGHVIGGNGETPIDLIHHDSLRLGTLYKPPAVTPGQTPGGGSSDGSSSQGSDGSSSQGSASLPGTTIAVKPAGTPTAKPTPSKTSKAKKKAKAKAIRKCKRMKGKARKRCFAKLNKKRRARAAAANKGSFTLEAFKQVKGQTYPAGGDSPLFGIVEEDYTRPTCAGAGSFQTWGMTDKTTSTGAAKLGLLDSYETELAKLTTNQSGWAPVTGLCSAHYFDYRDGIVAGGWYEEGTRFLDVRDPTNIKQVGYWVPTKGETWSVVFPPTDPTGTIVYALDFARGIDVLKLDRTDIKQRVAAPVRRSWLTGKHGLANGKTSRTGLSTRSRYGYLCRLAVASAA